MTTPAPCFGRPTAILGHIRGTSRFLAIGLLACCSLPALAQPRGDLAQPRDPLDAGLLTPVDSTAYAPLPVHGRSLMFARDVRSLFEAAPVAAGAAFTFDMAHTAGEGRIKTMLKRALGLLGTPYRWGGTSPEGGFDCSGLVGYVFRNSLGIELPRVSRDMAKVGEQIHDRNALAEGDLVFFSRRGKLVDHVGIYIGNGQFVHAPRTGKDVEVANLATGYWSQKFFQARRVATQ